MSSSNNFVFSSSSSPSTAPILSYPPTSSLPYPATYPYARPPYASPNPVWSAVPATWSIPGVLPTKKPPRLKKRTPEEEETTKSTAARVVTRLAQDHAAVLNPDTETPFTDCLDVVNRLLPYHVFLQPRDDLDRKGKGKAEELKAEIRETKFALECFKRKRNLEARFRKIKTRSGKRPASDEQAVVLAQAVLEADRAETNLLNHELRTARAELDKIERDKRARMQQVAPAQYYRAYAYPYAQQYAPASSTTVFQAVPPPSTTTTTPIPVQIPVSSLVALHALGIHPVAAISLVPGTPLPPAVLRSSDGTVLNLEIIPALLEPAQRNGLAVVVNSLIAAAPAASTTT
ncbi:hypothetical protein FB45DRAFT_821964 [Roridomyces roridus]|uniref:GLTSCR protein conserved domain-containing protein n=1 Tax=Roridomyces roridus TaxID=1738132 RepID=A0AAD7CF24_9AGAR|nr:hypothetical protein FB45DRAFT_821964 [Roridomyces roridus]